MDQLLVDFPKTNLSSRPERTRISCHAALDAAACAPFRKERRMKSANATNFHRKSGVAEWRDLRFSFSQLGHMTPLPPEDLVVFCQSETDAGAPVACPGQVAKVLGDEYAVPALTLNAVRLVWHGA